MAESTYTEPTVERTEDDSESSDGSDDGAPDDYLAPADGPSSSSSAGKKKKKKSKLAKFKLQPAIPQPVVNGIVERVRRELPGATDADVRAALDQLNISEYAQGKSDITGKNRKDMGDYKFWSTQPVTKIGEAPPQQDGYIEPSVPREQVRQEPYPLPKGFEWSFVDINDAPQLKELYELLSANYVEDDDATFRFKYSAEFFQWALQFPHYHKEWHIGVRVSSNQKLVAFISGTPITLRVRQAQFKSTEINFLCVHKKLRNKRLAPVLIKEVTRQCHLQGIFQAIHTSGTFIPTPVTACRYYHRLLNVPKLIDTGFTGIKQGMTVARMVRFFKLPSQPQLLHRGLREMANKDIPDVKAIWNQYMKRFGVVPVMTTDELRHLFLGGIGKGPVKDGRRDGQVVWSYVVEDPETHKVTDYFSFYSLPSSVLGHSKYTVLDAAYLFYYGSSVAAQPGAAEDGRLKRRVSELVHEALILADQAGFDVFNALTLMDNDYFLDDLKFGKGNGILNHYLYNWRTQPLAGIEAAGEHDVGRGMGVVMF
ncbi:N-myristoyl transferase [Auricularia subglabra TFB-10046 SS5]|nr:N-myristoyl transferase [Auricularia subglabra TFB-10046 SS5]